MHATKRETERVQQLRVQYWRAIGQVKLENLVFVDETGVNLAMTRRYARSVRGSRAYNHARMRARTKCNTNWCNGTKRAGAGKKLFLAQRMP
ncbi:MAG: hypothetical protein H0U45_09130 [Tatlockia sp.]|nr:hypothetical protein [Tatlockia sp.]